MPDVLKNLVDGLSVQWTRLSQYWKVPNSASSTQARQRLGAQVMRQLFEQVVHPMATAETPGAFLGELRLMAVDGTLLDVAVPCCQCPPVFLDILALAAAIGRHFPKYG